MGLGMLTLLIIILLSLTVGAALAWLAEPGQLTLFSRKRRNDSILLLNKNDTPNPPAVHASESGEPSQRVESSAGGSSTTQESTESSIATTEIKLEQLVETVNSKLPQTQCAQCGYPGCRPYATAIVKQDVPINQCPPGGDSLIVELAGYLGKPVVPLDSERGQTKAPQVAYIDESACIGCVLCIAACPVDAIVGASRYMHTVISDHCTGCELCLPPCPVDCIELKPIDVPLSHWRWPKPA